LKRIIVPFSNDDKVLREEKKITFLSTTEVSLSLSLFLFPFFGKKKFSLLGLSHHRDSEKIFLFRDTNFFISKTRRESPSSNPIMVEKRRKKKKKMENAERKENTQRAS